MVDTKQQIGVDMEITGTSYEYFKGVGLSDLQIVEIIKQGFDLYKSADAYLNKYNPKPNYTPEEMKTLFNMVDRFLVINENKIKKEIK